MAEYHFDDLGWYQFERLVQGLLKAELGLAVESWGGRGDWGRDAWCGFPLALNSYSAPEPGPFIFQLKFVEHANAAGAKPEAALKDAVNKEVAKLRGKQHTSNEEQTPRQYVFITNATLTPTVRTWISDHLASVYSECQIHTWGGKDLGDMLHVHPNLCRAYPEILSLRNLDILLGEVVNRDILNRSADALAFACDLAPAFVATATYFSAFETLSKYHFVVLDGPPEMGKTTIARMIGLAQMTVGWEVFECQTPQDIDRVFQRDNMQIFIADDAFGRTEYDPIKGRAWEDSIPRLLHRLDGKHWLIWTSRKHILERALGKMDLQAPARKFPDPGEVVVTASELSLEEKALILYRHAKSARLGEQERSVVKEHAKIIVQSRHFTPERIRRLCEEKLTELCAAGFKSAEVADAIVEAINNPTASMQKSYRALTDEYRWLLIAKLGQGGDILSLRQSYEAYIGPLSDPDFIRRLDDLDGTFVHRRMSQFFSVAHEFVDWVHPSFRDLVIDELANDLSVQERYWQHADFTAIAIALSESGGAQGKRHWPLLGHEQSWIWFGNCCERLAGCSNPANTRQLLSYLTVVWEQREVTQDEKTRLSPVVDRVLRSVAKRWETDLHDASESIASAFCKLCDVSGIAAPLPDFGRLFEAAYSNIESMVKWGVIEIVEELDEWLQVTILLNKYTPAWFLDPDNLEAMEYSLSMMEEAVTYEVEWSPVGEDADVISEQPEHLRSIAKAISSIQDFLSGENFPTLDYRLIERCESRADSLEEEIAEIEPDEQVAPTRATGSAAEPFDPHSFFADL